MLVVQQALVYRQLKLMVQTSLPSMKPLKLPLNARRGEGPSVIETITNRFYGHFEGDPGLIRSKEEVEFIKENKDPLKIFREKVKGKIDEAKLDEIDAASKANVDDAVAKARAAAYPKPEQLLTDVYVSY